VNRHLLDPATLELQKSIKARIGQLDLFALLDLLEYMGYERDEVLFKSHFTHASPSSLLHSVDFRVSPRIQVIVTVNMGLLSPDSPLPTYFFRMLESGTLEEDSFIDFIDFFNHEVIHSAVMSLAPERDQRLYPDWNNTKACYLSMTGLRSNATLHWLFQKVFPELEIEIGNTELQETIVSDTITLGATPLGSSAVFGSQTSVPSSAFVITLACDEEMHSSGRAWARVIEERLDLMIFEVLADAEIYLSLFQVIRAQTGGAKLTHESYLGYDKLPGGREQQRRIRLFEGRVRRP
jgi:hypothetical protein